MRRFKVVFYILLLCPGTILAQQLARLDSILQQRIPEHAVKFSPLHLINFYPSIQLAYEFRVAKRATVQADAGYVLNYDNLNRRFMNKRGVKLRVEFRYFPVSLMVSKSFGYVSVEPYWNAIDFDRITSRIECFDADCSIQYRRSYRHGVMYREEGIGIKYGSIRNFGKFLIDFCIGFRVRHINYIKPEFTQGGFSPFTGFSFYPFDESKRVELGPVLGLRAGYRLR